MSLSSLPLNVSSDGSAAESRPKDHIVQFYEGEDFLCKVAGDYLECGLRGGEALLVVATGEHCRAFERELAQRGIDVDLERQERRLVLLDADEALAKVCLNGAPEWDLFERELGGLMDASARVCRSGRVRAYAEMVDLLWREGLTGAALALEGMWNRLSRMHSFSLLCAYSLAHFHGETDGHAFQKVSGSHDHPSTHENGWARSGDEAHLREVSLLQQRARALEGEVHRRRQLETSLREALAARQVLDDELRRQNEELSRKVRFSEMFVGILGHDLRNPLSAITTAAQVLARRADSDRVALPAKRITNSAMRMSRMIDQLLDFTRIRLGNGIPIDRKPTNLSEICRLVVDELDIVNGSGRIRFEATGNPRGEWDGDRLGQLVSNLIGNGLAHGAQDRPVAVRIEGSGDSVVIDVHNGGAMSAEALAALFQPFGITGEKKTHSSSGGFGLGLYISQQIVLAHSGTIEVTSSEAEGTRIVVRLPRAAPTRDLLTGARE
jgi:signal transduction histidine kinase